MDERELIDRHRLGDPLARSRVGDCRLSFREQQASGEIWCVATGPLGTVALPLAPREALLQAARGRPAVDERTAARAGRRYASWEHVAIGDLTVALRLRGDALDFAYLFADGTPFGGGATGLPTARRASVIDRMRMRLTGRRGHRVVFTRHGEGPR